MQQDLTKRFFFFDIFIFIILSVSLLLEFYSYIEPAIAWRVDKV